jgi:hypothetical protein
VSYSREPTRLREQHKTARVREYCKRERESSNTEEGALLVSYEIVTSRKQDKPVLKTELFRLHDSGRLRKRVRFNHRKTDLTFASELYILWETALYMSGLFSVWAFRLLHLDTIQYHHQHVVATLMLSATLQYSSVVACGGQSDSASTHRHFLRYCTRSRVLAIIDSNDLFLSQHFRLVSTCCAIRSSHCRHHS